MQIDNNTLFFGNFVDADLKLADLQDYLNDISKFINRKKRNKEKKYEKSIFKNISIDMFTESFTAILFESVLISAWIFMEAEFKGYCDAMQKALSLDLSYSDLKGTTIEKFRNYTSKALKVDLMLKNENWEDLKAINELRNCLVHNEGIIRNKKLVSTFAKRQKLSNLITAGTKISLDKHSLLIIITLCRLYIERIYWVALNKFPGQHKLKALHA